jgi:hypothetical protein
VQLARPEPRDGAGIVVHEEAQRLAPVPLLINPGDLVRERLADRCLDGEDRRQEVDEADAIRLGN